MKKGKIAVCLLLIVGMVGGFSACDRAKGLRRGFGPYLDTVPDILVGVSAPTDEFNVDRVTLSFHIGIPHVDEIAEYEFIGWGLYFCNDWRTLSELDTVDDYENIEGLYCSWFLLEKDYRAEDYAVTEHRFSEWEFSHSMEMTIPAYLFTENPNAWENEGAITGTVYYAALAVYKLPEGSYRHTGGNCGDFYYRFIGDNTVKLS